MTDAVALRKQLEQAPPPGKLVQLLREIGFRDRDLARATGAGSPSTVAHWRHNRAAPSEAPSDRLDVLRLIVASLLSAGRVEPDRIPYLLTSRRRELGGLGFDKVPLDYIAADKGEAVYEAAKHFGDIA